MDVGEVLNLRNFLLILVVAVSLCYLHFRKKYGYWESRGIKQAKPTFLVGTLLDILLQPLHEAQLKNYRKYGRVYGTYLGTQPSLTVGDPTLLKLIMVKDFNVFSCRRAVPTGNSITDKSLGFLKGEEWKRVRAVVGPSFTSGKMRKMSGIINDCAQTLIKHLLKVAEGDSTVECKRCFGSFAMDTIACCAFGIKINSEEDGDNPFVVHARKTFEKLGASSTFLITLFPWLFKYFAPSISSNDAVDFYVKTSTHIIQERESKGERANDFLQLVMDARAGKELKDGETAEMQELESQHEVGTQVLQVKNKVLYEDEAMAQCLVFFLTSYETTSTTLSLAAYFLALNPECQQKLIKEVDAAWEKNMGNISFDVVSKMEYLDAIICETLRIYTPIISSQRIAERDYVLGDMSLTIKKGMEIEIPLFAIHHDPEWYPEPEKFDPERFSPINRAARDPYTFIPFGAGPRNCIGMRFALMEIKLCLVRLLRHVKFVRSAKTQVPPDFLTGQGFLQPKSIYLKVVKRSTSSLE